MKQIVGVVLAVLALSAAPAVADGPTDNGHDCAGATVSSLAGPGFGQEVAALAQQQLVDNLGLADCGQTNRGNL